MTIQLNEKIKEGLIAVPFEYASRNEEEYLNEYRSQFQRDRDRILYSNSFRRLSGKTQVFLSQSHDHVRNRLTHSLEVSQIARVTARNLGLNETLSEAISLGHDLGHTPFGHVGERALNLIMNNCGNFSEAQKCLQENDKGFKHNLQSIRVCCELNRIYPNVMGMNLTNFTLWGIRNHSSVEWKSCEFMQENDCYLKLKEKSTCENNGILSVSFYQKYDGEIRLKEYQGESWSFEAYVVELADEIAQRTS